MANAYTVLVVDDEPPIRRFLRASLTAAGHRAVTADDAAGALARMRPQDQVAAEGIRAPRPSGDPCRQGADAPPIVAGGLGAAAGRGGAVPRGVHPRAAAEAGARPAPAAPYPDRARGGLPPA